MIQFQRPDLSRRSEYEHIFHSDARRGCEYSLANRYMWGKQEIAVKDGCLMGFSQYHGKSVYPFPAGTGDVRSALDDLMEDARERGIPCRLTSLVREDVDMLESWYPGKFTFHSERDNFDYVYDIQKLAELKGRKYQQKRNHVHRFWNAVPEAEVVPVEETTMPAVRAMVQQWYTDREKAAPDMDFRMEKEAIGRAMDHFAELGLVGILLMDGDTPVAVTMGSFLSPTVFDVHFEKAREDIPGAYAAINQEFSRYLHEKYPGLLFLNREDDLGIEGLRKAKLSYSPEYMVEKYRAYPKEDAYEN